MSNDLELKQELAALLEEKANRIAHNKFETLFPSAGPYSRQHYPKHLTFMAASEKYKQLAFIAGNRIGKTQTAAFMLTCWLTGIYPSWWEGRRFSSPIKAWACGINSTVVKTVLQEALLGSFDDQGTGLIPLKCLGRRTRKAGLTDAIDTQYVKHVSGGWSEVSFKSYEEGRAAFQGSKINAIWLDEEPGDVGIYNECLTRTADKENGDGEIVCTFTPLLGISDVVLSFAPDGVVVDGEVVDNPYKFVIQAAWSDVPHLTEEWKAQQRKSIPPNELAAREFGSPGMGSGRVYPFNDEKIFIKPFPIPAFWPRVYGLDVGYNLTAATFWAQDPNTKNYYIYDEHYEGGVSYVLHASAIKARGAWMTGVVDPASAKDIGDHSTGLKLLELYQDEGLNLIKADNAVAAGIFRVYQLFETGRLKIFDTCCKTKAELGLYRRNDKGHIIKSKDHAMDTIRYVANSGLECMTTEPDEDERQEHYYRRDGVSDVTGY